MYRDDSSRMQDRDKGANPILRKYVAQAWNLKEFMKVRIEKRM